jgi:plastocyanin
MKPATNTSTAISIAFIIIAIQTSFAGPPYAKTPAAGSVPTSQPAQSHPGASQPGANQAGSNQPPSNQPPSNQPVTVKIDNFTYRPKELEISVGTTVTWQNADDVPHTATSKDDPQVFDSGPLDTDDKFSFTFTRRGKYTYYCKVHPHMTGVVIVK